MNTDHKARRMKVKTARARNRGPAGDPEPMHMVQFGSGVLYSTPVGGNPVTDPPRYLGKLEEVKVSFKLKPSEIESKIETLFSDYSARGRITSIQVNPEIMFGFAAHRTGGGNSRQRRIWRRAWSPRKQECK